MHLGRKPQDLHIVMKAEFSLYQNEQRECHHEKEIRIE